jgi:hypothetical protein
MKFTLAVLFAIVAFVAANDLEGAEQVDSLDSVDHVESVDTLLRRRKLLVLMMLNCAGSRWRINLVASDPYLESI